MTICLNGFKDIETANLTMEMVATDGGRVAQLSSKGLGHSGGTLDQLKY